MSPTTMPITHRSTLVPEHFCGAGGMPPGVCGLDGVLDMGVSSAWKMACTLRRTKETARLTNAPLYAQEQYPVPSSQSPVAASTAEYENQIAFYSMPNSFASAFHLLSTSARVFASITISSGHGRAKPSVDHLRVASMPIFEP